MTRRNIARAALLFTCLATAHPVSACREEGFEPSDVDKAEIVVVGRVTNYRIVPNLLLADNIRKSVENGTAPAWQRKKYYDDLSGGRPVGGTYGRFDVVVEDILKGDVEKTFSATIASWSPPSLAEQPTLPSILSGPYLVALQLSPSDSGVGRSVDAKLPTVLTHGCNGRFLFRAPHGFEVSVREHLARTNTRKNSSAN